MKNRNTGLFIFIIIFVFGCGDTSEKNNTVAETPSADTSEIKQDVQLPASKASESVIGFLNWYSRDHERINKINMVNNSEIMEPVPGKFYSVNFEATEQYLSELKASGYISDTYLEKWRVYFKNCEKDFMADPVNEGPPSGFEYDFIMWSQDYYNDLKNINEAKVVSDKVNNQTAEIVIEFPSSSKLTYHLSAYEGKWLIDEIQNTGSN